MIRIVIRRLLWSIPLLFVVSALLFVLVSLVPGDAARTILGQNATPEQYAALREQLGLDESLPAQYWAWLSDVLSGSLGASVFSGQPVTELLSSRLEVSLSLVVVATLAATAAGVALGLVSALRGGTIGRAFDVFAQVGLALPNFWLGLILIALFAVALPIFPATGYVPIGESPGRWAVALVLPVIALGFVAVAVIAKQTRDSMLDALGSEFIKTLQANGYGRRSIVYRHALRNAAPPVLAVVGVVFVNLLGGAVLVENIFALPGLGSAVVQATTQHDVPVIQGAVLYFTVMVVVVNLTVDLLHGYLDPRIRVA